MKKIVFMLALIVSAASFAQENSLSSNVSKSTGHAQKGMYVGLDYMNLTDLKLKATLGNRGSSEIEGGTHIGFAGLTLGYNQTPDSGIGFSAGVRFLESLNKNEVGYDTKWQMIIPEGNITFAANSFLLGYAGLNAAVWTGPSEVSKYKTQVGGQAGIGLRFTRNFAFNAGYTILSQKLSEKTMLGDYDMEIQLSGFNSNIVYTF